MKSILQGSDNSTSAKRDNIKNLMYAAVIVPCLLLSMLWIGYTIRNSLPEDFRVFYESARAALGGNSVYRTYGPIELPYWYLPWLSWFYIPLAFFSQATAYTIYITISILCAFTATHYLSNMFQIRADLLERLFMLCMSLSLCWLLFRVGQMDFILLAITVLMMHWIHYGKPHYAALLVPVLLFKPHLFIVFLPFALIKGRKPFLFSAAAICVLLLAISFLLIPDWPQQMLQMLMKSGQRTDNNWNFTTLPNLLGWQENWSGTANLPITAGLILVGFAVVWKFRSLDTFPLLSLALTASLFCAPRAYSYNFPLMIPAMVWVSAELTKPIRLLFWLAAGTIPFLFRFSTGTYLIVLIVFILGIRKAYKTVASRGESGSLYQP